VISAKQFEKDHNYSLALQSYKKASEIRKGDPVLLKKIDKMKSCVEDQAHCEDLQGAIPTETEPFAPSSHRSSFANFNNFSTPQKYALASGNDYTPSYDPSTLNPSNTREKKKKTKKICTSSSDDELSHIQSKEENDEFTEQKHDDQFLPIENSDFLIGNKTNNISLSDGLFVIPKRIFSSLFDYQRECVQWLWSVHNLDPSGCCLADDMGLGKTFQIVAFLTSLFFIKLIKRALIVLPVSLIENWVAEFKKWNKLTPVHIFHGISTSKRNRELDFVLSNGGICLTSYGLVSSDAARISPEGTTWDYVVLDEAHTIKNHTTKIAKAVRCISSLHRVVLTGTPVTNNLQVFVCFFDLI
jgi:SNF2 family DNA or RNA helicase